jgi:hypothetical protein
MEVHKLIADSNSGGSGTSSGVADAKRPDENARHGRKHRLTSSDVNNENSALLGIASEPHLIKRLKKKIKVIQPISKQFESELNAKGESMGAGSGNGQQLGSSSEEGSAEDPAQSRNPENGAPSDEALPSEPLDTKNQLTDHQVKGPALDQVQSSLHAIYSWYNVSRNAYLEQAKSYIEVIERQNAARSLLEGKVSTNSEETEAVQRAVEVSIQIMRASAEVEARQRRDWLQNAAAAPEIQTARQ